MTDLALPGVQAAIQRVRDMNTFYQTHCRACDKPLRRGSLAAGLIKLHKKCVAKWNREHPAEPTIRVKQCLCGRIYQPHRAERACHDSDSRSLFLEEE